MNQALYHRKRILAGLLCIVLALVIFTYLNIPTFKENVIRFSSTYKDRSVTLEASLWEQKEAEYAVLICPGYSCDREKWRPFADLFVKNGYTTMVFDYAGQGASSSTIGFDNAKTDAIPAEIDDALDLLHEKTGIEYDHMILVGHSMGGRAILRLMSDYNREDAVTRAVKKDIAALILISPEVNYSFNAQASLFAGTSDDVEEPWCSYTEKDIAGTDVYIYGSTADDIVSDENILAIYERLGAKEIPHSGLYEDVQMNSVGSKLTVGITAGVLHSYQMYSPEFAQYVNSALEDISEKETQFAPRTMYLVYLGWFLSLAGVGMFLSGIQAGETGELNSTAHLSLRETKKFLIWKLIIWIPGLIAAFLICCVCVILPFGSPVMNLPYMCCIAGYGLVMCLLYRKGRFPGVEGKLPPLFRREKARNTDPKSVAGVIVCSVLLCTFVWYVLRSSMYRLIPFNARLFWVTFAGILMTIGYYVSGCEADMLKAADASRSVRLLYNLIQYVALFLLVGFYMVIKSYSGMIGQLQNMILMYIFCIPLGEWIRRETGSRPIGAFVTGFLFQTLMITSSALIAIF